MSRATSTECFDRHTSPDASHTGKVRVCAYVLQEVTAYGRDTPASWSRRRHTTEAGRTRYATHVEDMAVAMPRWPHSAPEWQPRRAAVTPRLPRCYAASIEVRRVFRPATALLMVQIGRHVTEYAIRRRRMRTTIAATLLPQYIVAATATRLKSHAAGH